MVAWPPQVTMLTLGAFRCASPLTGGTTYGPRAAGVRSTTVRPSARSTSSWCRCAPAEVASKTIDTSANSSILTRPATPSWVVATFSRRARARPSESGSMPAMAAISRDSDSRRTLIIRSVPMLPDPMTATLVRAFVSLLTGSLLPW